MSSNKLTLFGEVPDNWAVSEIGEIAELRQGLQISKKLRVSADVKGSIPLLKITDLPNGIFSEYVKDIPENYIASKEDIIYTRTGQVGLVYTNVQGCVHNNCFKVILDYNKFDKNYIYYYLNSKNVWKYSNSVASGSVQKDLTHGAFKKCLIAYPELDEQRAIGIILSTLDEKIETNNQINKKLEEMAQAIFKQWFVDFEFPNENGEPYKSSGGEMVESEMGMIPKGWKVREISSIFNVKDGTHNSPKAIEKGYPLVTSKHLMDTRLDFETANKISEVDYNEVNKRSKVNRYDILISMIGTVGNLYLVQNEEIKFAIKNVGLFKTSERLDLYEYMYCYLNTPIIRQYIKERMAGSTQQYISLSELRKIPIILPKDSKFDLIKEFKKIANPIFNEIYTISNEVEKLAEARDKLLPKLMSGEIRVPINN